MILQNTSKTTWISIFLSVISFVGFAYFINRTQFYLLLGLYSILFIAYLQIVYFNQKNLKLLTYTTIGFRVLFLLAIPNLSNDFYRFIWDGRLIWEGMNPYLYLPVNDTTLVAEGQLLYEGMGVMNGSHFTCYPPINQFTFVIPALFFAKNLLGSTIIMRLLIILADIGTLYFGKKIATILKLPTHTIFYYILNPFIILELTGNLHFEGVMIFCLVAAIYYLFKEKNTLSAVLFSLAISVKLIPLLFLPIFYKKLQFKKSFYYFSIVGLCNILFFIPFLSQNLIDNFMTSIHLYFQNFEFNASIYYIIREIGYEIKGYNIIKPVGKITPIIVTTSVLIISFFRKNQNNQVILSSMLFSICIYYSLASVVHPWYIAIPLLLSIYTQYKFALVWSFCIMLSYAAYQTASYHENLYLVSLEYFIVYGVFIYEVILGKKINFKPLLKQLNLH